MYIEKAKTNSGLRIANPIGKLERMELFQKAITVKLSHKDKYLVVEDNPESVYLDCDGSLKNAVGPLKSSKMDQNICASKVITESISRRRTCHFLVPVHRGGKLLRKLS
ncbi:hypothetical protein RHMOL_Rhmol07G0229800 [Rhododendron molle]|uniref:Uncharacterized protein n=1 Tax=Rhododendron molle TaxID=49168 RepID=A0ACC0N5T0_RHOML|nr:hypothetical protein RHMOL_Rhmol07G0229800 [Rhododendron molle]